MASLRDYLETRIAMPANFSPEGGRVLVLSDLTGTVQLYTVAREGGDLQRLTSFREPVAGGFLPNADRVLMQMDEGGNERLQLYLLNAEAGGRTGEPEKLVHSPDFIHRFGGATRDGTLFAYGCNRRNGVDFDVYVGRLNGSERAPDGSDDRRLFAPGGWCEPAGFSPDGRWLAVLRPTERRSGDNDLYLLDVAGDEVVHVSPHDEEAAFGPPAWLPDSRSFFFATSDRRDTVGIARYDLASRSWEYVIEREWDLLCHTDWTGAHLLVEANQDGYSRLELLDPATLAVRREVQLPGKGVVTNPVFSQDGRWLAYFFTSSAEPGDVWLYDTETEESRRLTDSPKPVPPAELVEPELHHVSSFDGEVLPVFLFTPRKPRSRPAPVVVMIHGGPEGQFRPVFNPVLQYFAAQGYAVAGPNVRGSTGYGKRFEHLDDVRLRLDSVRDLAALHDWLRATGTLDPDRVVLVGGSYGGYMVLAGLAFHPERWAAGIDIVGISNLVTLLENTAPWRRKVREPEYGLVERDRDFLLEASPITHVDRITAPVFIIHGANDPRVPLSEAEQIYRALGERGIPCELAVYPDEGHGLGKLPNRIDAFTKAIAFLERVLEREEISAR
jgi:protease II